MAMNGLSKPNAGQARRLGEVRSEPALETDAELVAALKGGDIDAAGRLYDRYIASVQGVVYRLLGPKADFEDIVQEVFIYALSSIDKLREPALLKSWLLGIGAGKVRAHLRRSWRRRWLSFLPQEELPDLPAETNDPHAELLREAYSILDQMPPDERLALLARRVEGLPIGEAAKACGMSLSTFKRRLAKGESRFLARASQRPSLAKWLSGGSS
jgi:RNA polymerase sigma-70 factor (ECF subfamily)